MEINKTINRYITMAQLIEKLAGRSRSQILKDVQLGLLPKPVKFAHGTTSRSYFSDEEVEAALQKMRGQPMAAPK